MINITAVESSLFNSFSEEDLRSVLPLINVAQKRFPEGQNIVRMGTRIPFIGMVRRGVVRMERCDFFGNREVVGKADTGEIFGEVFVCAGSPYAVDVQAETNCEILFFNPFAAEERNTEANSLSRRLTQRLKDNLLRILAEKSLRLSEKTAVTSCRATKDKLLTFLNVQAAKAGGDEFVLPFDRQELADYLGVDRSAMCARLSQLKADGFIDYHKNRFRLLRPDK